MQVINISKAALNKKGYRDLEHWLENPNHVYIGRDMSFYVKGANKSKWSNPFSCKKYGRQKCIQLYEEYIIENKDLMNALPELKGKILGCWCKPESCHGDILMKLCNK